MKITPSFIAMIVKIHDFFKGSEKTASFFNTANSNLGGATPLELILNGRQEKLEKWVHENLTEAVESKFSDFANSYMVIPPNEYLSFQGLWIEKRYQEDDTFLWAAFMGRRNSLSKKHKVFLMEGSHIVNEQDISDRRYSSFDEVVDYLSAFIQNERNKEYYFPELLKYLNDNYPKAFLRGKKDVPTRSGSAYCPMCDSFDCKCSGC
ncbi:hypothetical protein [Bdellovibrio sp. BCCA]|uniref:hypothetical protein n=1 Tax=Bdellovibrio sp. BCCA TaxID=3136281 RepID=UPI0030F1411C